MKLHLKWCRAIELDKMMEMFCVSVLSNVTTTSHMKLSSRTVPNMVEKLKCKFYLNIITLHLNVNSHTWLMARILDSIAIEDYEQCVLLGRV